MGHQLVILLLLLLVVVEAQFKKKPSKGKNPGGKQWEKKGRPTRPRCPVDNRDNRMARFMEHTVTTGKFGDAKPVADQPCRFDRTRNDCARCKPGRVQCPPPMEKWCGDKKWAGKGRGFLA